MKTTVRYLAAVAVAMLASFALVGMAQAAEPSATPTAGGVLSHDGKAILVRSDGNVPAHVTLTAEAVTLAESEFDMQPGEERVVSYTGEPKGRVGVTFAVPGPAGGETSGVSLSLVLREYTPPPPYAAIAGGLLLLGGVAFLLARTKPWRYRLVRAPESPPQPQRQRRAPRPAWASRRKPPVE